MFLLYWYVSIQNKQFIIRFSICIVNHLQYPKMKLNITTDYFILHFFQKNKTKKLKQTLFSFRSKHFSANLILLGQREKISFLFSHFFAVSRKALKAFIKIFKVFTKPFEAPQRSVKIKIQINFYFNTTSKNARVTTVTSPEKSEKFWVSKLENLILDLLWFHFETFWPGNPRTAFVFKTIPAHKFKAIPALWRFQFRRYHHFMEKIKKIIWTVFFLAQVL